MESNSVRTEIMEMLKAKFGGLAMWSRIESGLALKCAELPEPNNAKLRKEFIEKLKLLKNHIMDQSIPSEDLKFLDDEIELHEQTRMISLYEEKDDSMDPETIHGYSRLGKGTEGIIAIPQKYNYEQLSKLTNGVYRETGLVKFYISSEKTFYGKVVAEIFEHSQEIPIATVLESKKIDKETGEPKYKGIKLFGEKYTRTENNVLKEINLPFYVYRFITESNNEFILISTKSCEIGDYVVTGVQTTCDDYKMLTESAKLPTKLPFFFVQKIQNRIIRFKNHQEFSYRLKALRVKKETMFDYPFTVTKGLQTWKLKQPTWYKWLIWSWLTHASKGIFNNYPLHLMIIGPKMSGKSLLLNSLHSRSKETRNIFSGSSSTLKHLVPSFKYNPARLGYLAESNRFSYCDEFLRCLINTRTTKDGSQREESVAMMNDLLEHQKREAGSGISRVNVNMTSRIIATTNPIKAMENVEDLIQCFDESFLSRWMIYYQTEEHIKMVRNSNDSDLDLYKYSMTTNDWVSLLDYMHTFSAKYDLEKIKKIHREIPQILSENLNKHYDARHMHHIECLIDGIVKARCFMDGDMSFEANADDYDILRDVWSHLIRSWLNPAQIRKIPLDKRIFYMPENCQHLYWKLVEHGKPIKMSEFKEYGAKSMGRSDYISAWTLLIEMGLTSELDSVGKTYYMRDGLF